MASELTWLRSENRLLKKENVQLKAKNTQLKAEVAGLKEQLSDAELLIVDLTKRLEKLEYIITYGRRKRPSPKAELEEEQEGDGSGPGSRGTKRSRGGQPGHPGKSRKRPTRIDETRDHLPPAMCPDCIVHLEKLKIAWGRFTENLIFPSTWNIWHRIWSGECPTCDKVLYGTVTEALPNHQLGIDVALFAVYQHFILHLTYGKICHELKTYFGLEVAESTLVNAVAELAELYGPEYEKLKERMRFAALVFGDETGWKVDGDPRWLWAFINKEVALYVIRKSRGSDVPKEILGEEFQGAFVSDFFSAYNPLRYEKMQKCCTHLLGDTKGFTEIKEEKGRDGAKESRRLHEALKKLIREAVRFDIEMLVKAASMNAGHGPPDSEPDPDPGGDRDILAVRKAKRREFEERLDTIAEKEYEDPDCRRIAKRLRKYRDHIFLFVEMEEVEYTNNRAERGIRPNVMMRKIMCGNRSERGVRTHEVLMSIMQTQRMQGKDFFTEASNYINQTVFAPQPSIGKPE